MSFDSTVTVRAQLLLNLTEIDVFQEYWFQVFCNTECKQLAQMYADS